MLCPTAVGSPVGGFAVVGRVGGVGGVRARLAVLAQGPRVGPVRRRRPSAAVDLLSGRCPSRCCVSVAVPTTTSIGRGQFFPCAFPGPLPVSVSVPGGPPRLRATMRRRPLMRCVVLFGSLVASDRLAVLIGEPVMRLVAQRRWKARPDQAGRG